MCFIMNKFKHGQAGGGEGGVQIKQVWGEGGPCTVRSHVWEMGGGRGVPEGPCFGGDRAGGGPPCVVRCHASWVMVTWKPPYGQND